MARSVGRRAAQEGQVQTCAVNCLTAGGLRAVPGPGGTYPVVVRLGGAFERPFDFFCVLDRPIAIFFRLADRPRLGLGPAPLRLPRDSLVTAPGRVVAASVRSGSGDVGSGPGGTVVRWSCLGACP